MAIGQLETLVIGGERCPAADDRSYRVVNPATSELLAEVAEGGAQDIDRAVAAAKAAGPMWAAVKPRDRARLLRRFGEQIEERLDELSALETRNAGKPISDARDEGQMMAEVLYYYAGAIDKHTGHTIPTQANGQLLTFHEPLGVVGLITPWNFPMAIATWKIAPALAAGNTIVHKPASVTPLTALALGELALEAGIPSGVLNVVPGEGSTAGARLAEHPEVNKISFTGSTEVGAAVTRAAAGTIKRVTLELGGKSANIVFDDADLEAAAVISPMAVFANAGQDCCARSRILVQDSIADEFVDRFVRHTQALVIGDPMDDATQIGSLISARQRQTALDYIASGQSDGAALVQGGTIPDRLELQAGNYLTPAVLTGVRNDMKVAREEIFGPVASIITFADDADAIAIANNTPYGLSGSIWSQSGARALQTARALETGNIAINHSTSVHLEAPFGGFKQSGLGRELGMAALEHYTETKTVFFSYAESHR